MFKDDLLITRQSNALHIFFEFVFFIWYKNIQQTSDLFKLKRQKEAINNKHSVGNAYPLYVSYRHPQLSFYVLNKFPKKSVKDLFLRTNLINNEKTSRLKKKGQRYRLYDPLPFHRYVACNSIDVYNIYSCVGPRADYKHLRHYN